MHCRTLMLAPAALLCLGGIAAADTIRVPQDQATIAAAIGVAVDGDVILIKKGKYQPFSVTGKTGITLQAKGKVTIDAAGNGTCLLLDGCQRVTVMGIECRNAGTIGIQVRSSSDITIEKCKVRNTEAEGIRSDDVQRLDILNCKIQDTGDDGIALSVSNGPQPTDDSSVRNCKILRAGDDGIDLHGDDNVIQDNVIKGTREDGIEIDEDNGGNRNTIDGNKISKVLVRGIVLNGEDNVCANNKLTKTPDDAIVVFDTGNRVEGNTIIKPGFDGVFVLGGRTTVKDNKIKKPGDDGVDLEDDADQCTITGNTVIKASDNGFEIGSTSNTITDNKAKKSGGFDLTESGGGNTVEDNDFPNVD